MSQFVLRGVRRLLRDVEGLIARPPRRGPAPALPNNGKAAEIEAFLHSLDMPAGIMAYVGVHMPRYIETLTIVPLGKGSGRALELGCYMHMAPVLARVLGYGQVRGAYYAAQPGGPDHKIATVAGRPVFECDIDLFDAERHRWPYEDGSFDLVLCCELIEHMLNDPMHVLVEARRVLAPGGLLLVTTPNVTSLLGVASVLSGARNPQIYSSYPRPGAQEIPHVREYAPAELARMVHAAGLDVEALATTRATPGYEWVRDMLARDGHDVTLRGEQLYCLARRAEDRAIDRYPAFLYDT